MDSNELQKKWPELKTILLKHYPQLTREELVMEIGKEQELLLSLQKKLGKNWKEIKNMLSLMG